MQPHSSILLSIQYLPSIQYFTKLVNYEQVWIEQHEHYQKGSYRNRCHLAGANGLLRLSIPLARGKNEQLPIRLVRIAYDEGWQRQHWMSIRSAYSRAPYFDFYAGKLEPFFQKKWEFLFDFNWELLQELKSMIGIECQLKLTESYEHQVSSETLDFRNSIFPKKHRQKEDLDFSAPKYRQLFEEKYGFLPNLSILDLLFCTGPEAILYLEN